MPLDSVGAACDSIIMATKKPKPPKNADFSQLAKSVVDAATNETDEPPESAAVKRGRLGGLKGGDSRAKKLTAEAKKRG